MVNNQIYSVAVHYVFLNLFPNRVNFMHLMSLTKLPQVSSFITELRSVDSVLCARFCSTADLRHLRTHARFVVLFFICLKENNSS